MEKPKQDSKTEIIRAQLLEDMSDNVPSDSNAEYLRIISEQLRCSPQQALSIALKAKAHELTCKHAHQQFQYEPSRH